jgi:hypothetical protein
VDVRGGVTLGVITWCIRNILKQELPSRKLAVIHVMSCGSGESYPFGCQETEIFELDDGSFVTYEDLYGLHD